MIIKDFLPRARNNVTIRKIIIWNPYVNRALYVGSPDDIPKTLNNRKALAYLYDKNKQRLIIRVRA